MSFFLDVDETFVDGKIAEIEEVCNHIIELKNQLSGLVDDYCDGDQL